MSSSAARKSYVPPRSSKRHPSGETYRTIGIEADSLDDLITLLKKKGLPVSTFDRLSESLAIPTSDLASIVQIAERTLRRRRKEGHLRPDESERVLRIARLFDMASDVLETPERARTWMQTPLPTLGQKTPLEYADTEPGAREVENVLGRIAHGVFS